MNINRISMIASDIDGTLLDSAGASYRADEAGAFVGA